MGRFDADDTIHSLNSHWILEYLKHNLIAISMFGNGVLASATDPT